MLISTPEEERTWLVDHDSDFNNILLFNGPINGLVANRLLLLNPKNLDRVTGVTVIAEAAENEILTSALSCSDERILYTVRNERESELWLWQPKNLKKKLLVSEEPLTLLSCD